MDREVDAEQVTGLQLVTPALLRGRVTAIFMVIVLDGLFAMFFAAINF